MCCSTDASSPQDFLEEIVRYCAQIRRQGWMSLDARLSEIADPFLRKSLTLAVDNVGVEKLRAAVEVDLDALRREG